jgi:SAM-dependent methyltransferase
MEQAPPAITWTGPATFSVEGVNFVAVDMRPNRPKPSLAPGTLVFLKPAWMVRRYARLLRGLKPGNIFELGIWQGGSCVFFQRLAAARKLVTIDISEKRVAAVDAYIERYDLKDCLKPFYGVDQSDAARLREMVAQEFAGEALDLVVDDASHFLDETRASFNALFPFVRPGGAYVIEDWNWAHARVDKLPDDAPGLYAGREPLTKLVFELVLACGSSKGIIEKIDIDRNSATVWRGKAPIDPGGFDVARLCAARGRALIA